MISRVVCFTLRQSEKPEEKGAADMAKAVRLADIARIMNVSTVTVSKALSGQKGVSEELRERIRKQAAEMGYQPPAAARLARAGRGLHIGVVISERYFDRFESFYWQMYQEITALAASQECFAMLEMLGIEAERKLELPRMVRENQVDGIIIVGLLRDEYLRLAEQRFRVPLIYLDFYDRNRECDAVITDNYFGMYKMTSYLFDMGHRDIAYVGNLLYTESITDRYFGYAKALLEHGQQVRPEWVIDDRNPDTGQREGDFAFRLPERMPTAFACNCDLTAGVLINLLREKGWRIPEDISVVGYDNYIHPSLCSVGITTYEVDIREMVRRALMYLLGKMTGGEYRRGITIVPGHMVYKDSVKKLNKEDGKTADG